ncbi:MAG: hypothetical protein ACE5E1_10485, partial [Phycisphaerae bacterium]
MTSERTRRICYCMSWGMLCALVCTLVVPTLTFAVEPNRTVTVAVKDRVGTMLPDAIVNIRDAAGAPIKATALGDGTFYITNAQAGKATLEVDHPLQGSGTVEVVLPDQKVIGITITLENSVLVADVFNPDTPPARLPTPDIGNVFTGFRGTVCPVGGNGDLCFTAISATDGSVIGDLGDNTASGASDSCGFNNTIDEWYCYVATCDGTATVTTCNPGTTFDTILSAFDACAGLEIACNDDTVGAPAACSLGGLNRFSTISFPVLTGVSYLVRVTAFNDDFAGSGGFGTTYEIGFSCSAGGGGGGNVCVGGETQENEPNCGLGLGGLGDDTVNGGCNSFPTVFSPISCGETYCSSTAVIVDRDTDWYAFTVVGSDTEITFTATSTSGLVIGFVDTNDCATASALDPFAVLLPGDTASITRCFPPGTWWAFAGGDFGNPGPCPSEYSATLTCGAACAPPPTPCDDPNSGDCFSDNGTPGCNDPVCCNIVCAIDPFCCDVAWDGICAGEAADLCGGGGVPANDLCVDAIPVGVPSTTAGTTVNATTDSEAPFCGVSPTSPGVWYTVVGTGNTMTASLCNGVATYDSKLTVYCGDCTDFVCVDGNDDACGLQSEVSWCSQAGATYMILVHGFGGDNGPFELVVSDDGTP